MHDSDSVMQKLKLYVGNGQWAWIHESDKIKRCKKLKLQVGTKHDSDSAMEKIKVIV